MEVGDKFQRPRQGQTFPQPFMTPFPPRPMPAELQLSKRSAESCPQGEKLGKSGREAAVLGCTGGRAPGTRGQCG